MKTILRMLEVLALSGLLSNELASAQTISSPVTLSPSSAIVNVPTTIVATILITDPLVIPSSVNLVKIDTTGRSTIVGTMHDDGLNGDAVSNDRVFSLQFSLLEASAVSLSYKASAIFRGRLTRVQSAAVAFNVQPAALLAADGGVYHACALTSVGGVKCVGDNENGQLGVGTTVNSPAAKDVLGLSSGVRYISTGDYHGCAITAAGGVKCWGNNRSGQLGDGTKGGFVTTPKDVLGLSSGVISIGAGNSHNCAITNAGVLKCWGINVFGMLGDGSFVDSLTPKDVIGLGAGARSVSPGFSHTCALTVAGGIKCWGASTSGQLGTGATSGNFSTPQDVFGLSSGMSAVAVSVQGSHSCALTAAGGVKCWGFNGRGQLGNGTTSASAIPMDVVGLSGGVSAIAVGGSHSCALTAVGVVKCWGNNGNGQIGNGTQGGSILVPVDVVGLGGAVTAIAAGAGFTCALPSVGGVKCWGINSNGRPPDATFVSSPTPQDVLGF